MPVANRVGPEHEGWRLITSQLNHERITLATPGLADRLLDEVWAWAAKTPAPDGGRMLDEAWVQLVLARVYAKLEALKVLNWRSAWSITAGTPNMAEASAVKVMGTEFFVECYRAAARGGRRRRPRARRASRARSSAGSSSTPTAAPRRSPSAAA